MIGNNRIISSCSTSQASLEGNYKTLVLCAYGPSSVWSCPDGNKFGAFTPPKIDICYLNTWIFASISCRI